MDFAILIASVTAFVLYINTLDADFAYDDSRAVQQNQDLLPTTPIINIFYDDFWGTPMTHTGSHKSYRPLCVLSFRLNYFFGEQNPWGYHFGNVLLHAIVTALFTKLSRFFLKKSLPTLVSGLLFASHPVHTEAVSGVVGRADVGACAFFILSLLSYIKYVETRDSSIHVRGEGSRSWRFLYFVWTAIFTSASMLTKEQGVTVIGVCAAYDLFVHNKTSFSQLLTFYRQPSHRRVMEGVFLLGVLGLSLVAFRLYFMGNKPPDFASSDNPASVADNVTTRALTFLLLPSLNFWLLLCPRILSFDWSMSAIPLNESITDYRNIFSLMFYICLAYLAKYILFYLHNFQESKPLINGNSHNNNLSASKHSTSKSKSAHRQSSLTHDESLSDISDSSLHSEHSTQSQTIDIMIVSIAILILPFIPASNLFFYVGFVIAERILYIPSMGFCLLIGHGANILYTKYKSDKQWKRACVAVAMVSLLVLNGAKTMDRNTVWANEENLYKSGIAVNPAKAWGNLANVLNDQKKLDEAETAYRNALKYRPNMSDVHYNLGILLANQGRTAEAVQSYQNAIQFRPNLSVAHLNLGLLLADIKQLQEAEKVYRRCADLDTSELKNPRLHATTKVSCLYNLGRLYNDQQRHQEAIVVFEEALARRPDYYVSHSLYNMYGEVFANLERYDEAEHWYKKALAEKPDHIPAHLTMAILHSKKGNVQQAETWFAKARQLDENDVSVKTHYAGFLGDTGRLQESAQLYLATLKLNPDSFELNYNAANMLRQVQKNQEAETLFEKASQLNPQEALAHMNLGAMRHINGRLKEAETSYLRALALKPNDPTTQQNLQKLRNIMPTTR